MQSYNFFNKKTASFEANKQAEAKQKAISAILSQTDNSQYALKGAVNAERLYILFSIIALVELGAALFFYGAGFGINLTAAAALALGLAGGYHILLHHQLDHTSQGITFAKATENKALKNMALVNRVISLALIFFAAALIYFVGRPAFSAYRETQWEKMAAATPPPSVSMAQLTDSKGKLSVSRANAFTRLTNAAAGNTAEAKQRYDKTTATVADVVGVSAFIVEAILALLAYAIGAAKYAAVLDHLADGNSPTATVGSLNSHRTAANAAPISYNYTEPEPTQTDSGRVIIQGFRRPDGNPTASVGEKTATNSAASRVCGHCSEEFTYSIHNQKFCSESCRKRAWEARTGKKLKI